MNTLSLAFAFCVLEQNCQWNTAGDLRALNIPLCSVACRSFKIAKFIIILNNTI